MRNKTIKTIILSVLFLNISYLNALSLLTIEVNDEISTNIQKESKLIIRGLTQSLKQKNLSKFNTYTSSLFREKAANNDKKSFDNLCRVFIENDFELIESYHFKNPLSFSENSTKHIGTVVPPIHAKHKFITHNYTLFGGEGLSLFLKSNNEGIQYLFYLSLSKYDKKWKINHMTLANYAVNNLTTADLLKKAKESDTSRQYISSVLYALSAKKILRPSRVLQYIDEDTYKQEIDKIFKNARNKLKFPIKITNIEIINFDIFTGKSGIAPIFLYVTKLPFNKKDLEKEGKELLPNILEQFKGIKKNFSHVVFRAYNEMPTDPKKTYNIFNTVLKIKP